MRWALAFKRKKDRAVKVDRTGFFRKYRRGILLTCSVYIYGSLHI